MKNAAWAVAGIALAGFCLVSVAWTTVCAVALLRGGTIILNHAGYSRDVGPYDHLSAAESLRLARESFEQNTRFINELNKMIESMRGENGPTDDQQTSAGPI